MRLGRQMHGAIVRRTHPVDVGSDVKREERCGKFEQPHARDRKTAANTRPGIGVTELTSPVSSSTRMSTLTKPLKRSELVSRNRSVETREELVAALDRPSDDLGGRPAIGGDTHLDGR